MSPSIDNRVVEMQFDNKQFESGISQSTASLGKLKKGLDLSNSTKSLNELNAAGKAFSLTSISDGVSTIANRFSTLGIIGMTVIQNLTNGAMRLGQQMLNTLFLAPARTGFAEYETQMNAIQTVLANTASKGTTLEQVNDALLQLNLYADKTIYNFAEMAKNIGTFTAAGITLETSVSAIKGIANLAAVSGSNSQQAAVAMYQLSQALSSGTVRLMDWNSVVNAGMGGQVFQDALKETARTHKVAVDNIIKQEGSFRESLSKGWLTSQILTETLSKFTGDLTAEQLKAMGYTEKQITEIIKLGEMANNAATKVKTFTQLTQTLMEAMQSGWGRTWQIIIGDFEEAKAFMTELSDVFGGFIGTASDVRNNLLQGWKDLHGRIVLIDALRTAFYQIVAMLKIAKAGFTDVMKPLKAWDLWKMTNNLLKFADALVVMRKYSVQVRNIFRGIGAIFSIVGMAVSALAKGFIRLLKAIAPAGVGILNVSSSIGEWLFNLQKAIATNDIFNKAIDKMASILVKIRDTFKKVFKTIGETLKDFKTNISNMLKGTDFSGLVAIIDRIKERFSFLFPKKGGLADEVNKSGSFIQKTLTFIMGIVKNVFTGINSFIQKITPGIKKAFSFIGKIFSNLGNALSQQAKDIDFNTIFDAVSTGFIAGLIASLIRFINSGTAVFGDLSGFIKTLSKIFGNAAGILDAVRGAVQAWQQSIKADALLKIAGAVALLAASLVILSLINSQKLAIATGAITTMFAELVGSMIILQKASGAGALIKMAVSMIALSNGLFIMALALYVLAKLEPENLNKALLALTAIMTSIIGFTLALSKINIKKLLGNDSGIILLAVALQIIAVAVEKLGKLDPEVLKRGLIAISVLLFELAATMKIISGAKFGIGTAVSLIAMAAAFLVFAKALEQLGKLSLKELGIGLGAMAGTLLLITLAVKVMPIGKMMLAGIGLLLISAALVIFANALTTLSNMTWNELAVGLVALASSLIILTVAMYAMQGAILGAAAMLIVAGAIAILAPALVLLGGLPLKVIGIALLALVGVFAVLGVAALVMAPVIPLLLALAAALFLLGVATLAAGTGLLAFATGLAILATLGAAGGMGLVLVIKMLLSLIPFAAEMIGQGLTILLQKLVDSIPVWMMLFKNLLLGFIDVIIMVIPAVVDAILFLVTTILTKLAEKIPEIVQAGFNILLGLLSGIANNIGKVVETGMLIVINFMNGIAAKLPELIDAGWNLIISFIDGLTASVEENLPTLMTSTTKLGIAIVEGLAKGIKDSWHLALDAVKDLGAKILEALKDILGIASPSKPAAADGKYLVQGLANGIDDNAYLVIESVKELGTNALTGLGSSISSISQMLADEMNVDPTIRPVIDMTDIDSGKKLIDELFGNQNLNLGLSVDNLAQVSSGLANNANILQNGSNGQTTSPTTVSLTQYNYSPKPLSRLEIYRQTRNQLSAMRRLAGTV